MQRQRLEARPRLLATATATFHFVSFFRLVPFRFSGFAEWLRCAARRGHWNTKPHQNATTTQRQLCGNEIQMYLGVSLALLGVAHLPVCMSHVSPGEGCIHFIHISFHAPCVNSIQFSLLMCSLCVCVSVSPPNWYATLLLLVCSKLNWQRVRVSRIQQSTTPSTQSNTIQHD